MDTNCLQDLRTLLYDAYWPPFAPELRYDAARGIALCQRAGANAIRFGSIGKYALYPSRIVPPHPELDGRDLLQETLDAAKAVGIRVVGYIPVGHALPGSWLTTLKPQWLFRDEAGSPVAPRTQRHHFGGEPLLSVCACGVYRHDVLEIVREVLAHDVDAVYLDGPYHGWGAEDAICQCAACQERYPADTGRPLPDNGQCSDRGAALLEWSRGALLATLRDIRQLTRARNLPLLMNRTAAALCGTRFELAMLREVDGFLIESDRGGIEGCSVAAVLGKAIWNYTNRHTCHPRISNAGFERQSLLCGRRTLGLGGIPIVSYAGRFFGNDRHLDALARLHADAAALRRLAPGAVPCRYACVFRGTDDRPFAVPGIHGVEAMGDARNIADSLAAVGIPAMVLADPFLDDDIVVRAFSVLFVTACVALSPNRIARLEDFARHGGTVVFTGIVPPAFTGVEPDRPAPRLQAALDSQYWCDKRYDCYLRAAGFELLPQLKHVPLRGARSDVEVVAESVLFDAAGELGFPSVFRRPTGEGRCIVFDSPIEQLLSNAGEETDRFFRTVCTSAIEPPVQVHASTQPTTVSLLESGGKRFAVVVADGVGTVRFSVPAARGARACLGGTATSDGDLFALEFDGFEIVALETEGGPHGHAAS